MRWSVVCVALALLLAATVAAAADRSARELQFLTLSGPIATYRMALYSNRDLGGDLADATLAISIQHGLNRDGAAYFDTASSLAAALSPRGRVLVLAPQFFVAGDPQTQVPKWTSSGWIAGSDARGLSVSSLDAYDQLLDWLSDRRRFPRLERIVLAGHSGGAQLVQRYAALNQAEEKLRAAGISVRYVVANPSSYLYFTTERPGPSGFRPYDAAACPTFNDYKYGFMNPVRYAAHIDPGAAFERYALRDVIYLFGENDNDPDHSQLDKTCAARAQGAHRMERGLSYLSYLRHISGSRENLAHRAYEVSGVGHSQRRMMRSACGVESLFEKAAALTGAAACREIQ
jgi:pimeloyl-ACP methyl ester carboxylesterase